MKKIELNPFVKCIISSLISAVVDTAVFQGFMILLPFLSLKEKISIVIATIIARIISTTLNFIINKYWSFKSSQKGSREAVLFFLMFLAKMGLSAGLVAALSVIKIPVIFIKLVVDSLIFLAGFFIQKKFIFVQLNNSAKAENI